MGMKKEGDDKRREMIKRGMMKKRGNEMGGNCPQR
jgi:hypothetical protein